MNYNSADKLFFLSRLVKKKSWISIQIESNKYTLQNIGNKLCTRKIHAAQKKLSKNYMPKKL